MWSSQHIETLGQTVPLFFRELCAIPNEEKKAYLMALEKCPGLVETESPAERFLVCEDFDSKKAARRYVEYWQKRLQLFGKTNAFKPIALSSSCLTILKSGLLATLPSDRYGRPVLSVDMTITTHSPHELKMRCMFYLLQVLSENPRAQTDGIVGLQVFDESNYDSGIASFGLEKLRMAVPMKLSSLHIIYPPKDNRQINFFFTEALPVALRARGYWNPDCEVHAPQTLQEIRNRLQVVGLERGSIPVAAGGAWTPVLMPHWLHDRQAIEEAMRNHAFSSSTIAAAQAKYPGVGRTTYAAVYSKEDKKHEQNQRDSLNKRLRRKAEIEAIAKHEEYLKKENTRLDNDNAILSNEIERILRGRSAAAASLATATDAATNQAIPQSSLCTLDGESSDQRVLVSRLATHMQDIPISSAAQSFQAKKSAEGPPLPKFIIPLGGVSVVSKPPVASFPQRWTVCHPLQSQQQTQQHQSHPQIGLPFQQQHQQIAFPAPVMMAQQQPLQHAMMGSSFPPSSVVVHHLPLHQSHQLQPPSYYPHPPAPLMTLVPAAPPVQHIYINALGQQNPLPYVVNAQQSHPSCQLHNPQLQQQEQQQQRLMMMMSQQPQPPPQQPSQPNFPPP